MTKISKLSGYVMGCGLDTAFNRGYEQGKKDEREKCHKLLYKYLTCVCEHTQKVFKKECVICLFEKELMKGNGVKGKWTQ